MTDEINTDSLPPIQQSTISLLAEDTPTVRAEKSWAILGGQGPVNPVFERIFAAYMHLDAESFQTIHGIPSNAEPEKSLMGG